ncbi:MAG: penicillin-binding protein activator [Methylococcaceae bacterium]|nr:penicillin-binding protein activator [Methylococcaceae bacterium]MCI0733573.1 penicillin-binding protein activator [Methylococcaceae bacterium]
MRIHIGTILLSFLVIGAFSGCAQTYESITRSNYQREINQARKSSAQGDYKAAARIYRQLARKTNPPVSDGFLYLAAESLYRGGEIASSRKLADTINQANLSVEDRYRLQLLYGRILLAEKQPEQTLHRLEILPAAELSPEMRLDYHTQRARGFSLLGNHLESAREQIAAEELMSDPEAIENSQIAVMRELAALPNASLAQRQARGRDVLSGWMALTWIFKQAPPGTHTFDQEIREWTLKYPDHPAHIPALLSNVSLEREIYTRPEAIGVALPLSGPYAQVGEAIRQGILIARKYSSAPRIPTRFYNSDLADPVELYRQAVSDGANIIIGPLQKNILKSLATLNRLSVPVLGLNQVPELDVPNLYQFGLNPEDEVDQAANSAWFDGYHRALIFSPETSHGRRLASYFAQKWQQLGGEILRSVSYNPDNTDYDEAIKKLLQTDEDIPDEQAEPIGAAGSRKQSDFIFLIALPPHARLIKPMFQYYESGDLKVYGTSQIYSGHENPSEDQDLSGIVFCDIPWLFNSQIENTPALDAVLAKWEHPAIQYVRLMALGFDAYNLLPHLTTLESDPNQSYPGTTGTLSMTQGRHIRRQLICAEFENGVPVPRSLSPHFDRNVEQSSPVRSWSE